MLTKETFMKECVNWSKEEEMAAKDLAQILGRKIIADCHNRQPSNVDFCIMERIAGLNYLKDIGNALPGWHKGKNQAYKLHQMTEEIIRAAMK
jgi:hypothetical protein